MPKAPRIFVVEDDESIRMLLEVALRSSGYTVSAFPNAADALAEMENTVPDAAVLDIMLDGMDGITALKLMRANARLAGVPVMMLTAKDSENDKIIGLDAGADDYMTKPFSVLELCARVRALLRRGGAAPAPKKGGVLKSGGLKLDLAVREATRDGALLELTYKEFARNGYKIVTLNLIDTDRSDCWNPLQLIIDEYLTAKHGNNDLSQTSKLVSSFAHCLTDDTQSEAIWTDSARSLLSALIYYFLDKGYEKNDMSCVNMFSITTFFTEFGIYNTVIEDESGNKKEVNALDELFNALPVGCLARTSYSTSKFSQGETRSSIYTVLSGDLEIFMTDMGVQKLTSKSEIKFNDLIDIDRPCIIYMLVPYEEKSRYVIASMFADQSFLYLAKQARKFPDGKLPRKIEYMYDEFGQMTKLPDLSSKMNASPGANILFNLFLQDYGQLKKYEKEEDGIKGGCNIQIYILSLNGNTNKAFSEMIGNETVNYLTFSGSLYGFLDHQGERVDSKALLDTTQLSKLPFGTAIVKKMRCEPIKTNITPYHLLPNKMPRIPIDELPIKSRNIDLSAAMYPYDELWDSLGVIGYQYRLDSLKKTAERAMNDYYMQLGKIDQIKSDGSTVPESMYKAALEFEKNAGAAQRQVIEYQQQVQKLNEFRANEARKIFAEAYGTSGSDEDDGDYTDQDELYFPGEYPDDGPYVDITALLYKINGLVGSELGGFLSDQNYAAARGYIKKIQKRPDIRSNFVADEWAALEQYINNEELKNANT